jgi:hypothetical protein
MTATAIGSAMDGFGELINLCRDQNERPEGTGTALAVKNRRSIALIRRAAPYHGGSVTQLPPHSTPSSRSSESSSLVLEAKTLGAALAGAKRTGHQNGVPRQPSFSSPS